MSAPVISVIFAMFAQCQLILRLRTQYCAAPNGRNGPEAIIRLV